MCQTVLQAGGVYIHVAQKLFTSAHKTYHLSLIVILNLGVHFPFENQEIELKK